MHKVIEFFLLMVFASTGVSYPVNPADEKASGDSARAQELLTQARNALGGDAKFKAIQSLSCAGKFRRVLGPQAPEMAGEFEMDFLLPDKFKKTENMTIMSGAAEITRIEGFNGEQMFEDSSSSGGMVVIRRPGSDDPKMQGSRLRSLKADTTRTLLAFLLSAPQTSGLEFTYAGEAESPDGKADIIEAKSADGFAARLFLDQKTHQPLMLAYRGVAQRVVMRTEQMQAGSREEAEKKANEAEHKASEEAAKAPQNRQEVDIQIYLADYRPVDGILLPHKISRSTNGEVNEEWELSKFKINPPLKAEKFKK